jgi:hypothetical protein
MNEDKLFAVGSHEGTENHEEIFAFEATNARMNYE